jgi:hypothetical protein
VLERCSALWQRCQLRGRYGIADRGRDASGRRAPQRFIVGRLIGQREERSALVARPRPAQPRERPPSVGDRFDVIDQGDIPAYRFGRVIRLKEQEVDTFIDACRIEPGTLEHLYPEPVDTSGS